MAKYQVMCGSYITFQLLPLHGLHVKTCILSNCCVHLHGGWCATFALWLLPPRHVKTMRGGSADCCGWNQLKHTLVAAIGKVTFGISNSVHRMHTSCSPNINPVFNPEFPISFFLCWGHIMCGRHQASERCGSWYWGGNGQEKSWPSRTSPLPAVYVRTWCPKSCCEIPPVGSNSTDPIAENPRVNVPGGDQCAEPQRLDHLYCSEQRLAPTDRPHESWCHSRTQNLGGVLAAL